MRMGLMLASGGMLFLAAVPTLAREAALRIMKIAIGTDGSITADDVRVDLTVLNDALARLAADRGVVWYYREPPETKASAATAESVIELVIQHKTPICLSETPDYRECKRP